MKWFKWLLFPISILFWIITGLRNFFYDLNWLKSISFDIPIINVGNITVGGTGKTPHVLYIGNLLKSKFDIAFLSKGYKRETRDFIIVEDSSTPKQVGDEPLMIKRNFAKNKVAVDHNRVNGVLQLMTNEENIDCIIMDDAFQHRSIKAGLNILLIDFNRPLYKDYLLPIGYLRESSSNKKRADITIITKCPNNLSEAEANIFIKKSAIEKQVYFTYLKYDRITSLGTNTSEKLTLLHGKKIILITGIANQKPIIDLLNKNNCQVTNLCYQDHHTYTSQDVKKIIETHHLKKDALLLTTEKDAQKLVEFENLKGLPIYFLNLSIDFLWNKDKFDKKILTYVRGN